MKELDILASILGISSITRTFNDRELGNRGVELGLNGVLRDEAFECLTAPRCILSCSVHFGGFEGLFLSVYLSDFTLKHTTSSRLSFRNSLIHLAPEM